MNRIIQKTTISVQTVVKKTISSRNDFLACGGLGKAGNGQAQGMEKGRDPQGSPPF
jgi:hypothetical protein